MRTSSIRIGRSALAAVALGMLVLSQASPSWAAKPAKKTTAVKAPPKAEMKEAKKDYGEGVKKYKAGDYAGAEADFKSANEIKPTAQAERYIGLCEDAQGHFQAAAEWYDKFLAHVPEKTPVEGDEIKKRDGEIKALPGKVHVESNPPGASVTVDDRPQSAPTPMDVELPPGPHTIKLAETGRLPVQKNVEVAFASTQDVSATLELEPAAPPPAAVAPPPPAAPPPPPPPPPEARSKVPAYVTGGLAIVAAGVGTVFGIMTLSDKSDFDKNPTPATADNGDTHALITDMAFGVALTFGVTSAVLFLTKDEAPAAASASRPAVAKEDEKKKNSVTVTATPIVGAHTGGAGVLVRF